MCQVREKKQFCYRVPAQELGASTGARCQLRNRPEDGSSSVKQHPAEFAGWRLQTLVATRSYMEEFFVPIPSMDRQQILIIVFLVGDQT